MRKTATITNYEAEAIMEALEFYCRKREPSELTEAMQRMYKVLRDNNTINILED